MSALVCFGVSIQVPLYLLSDRHSARDAEDYTICEKYIFFSEIFHCFVSQFFSVL